MRNELDGRDKFEKRRIRLRKKRMRTFSNLLSEVISVPLSQQLESLVIAWISQTHAIVSTDDGSTKSMPDILALKLNSTLLVEVKLGSASNIHKQVSGKLIKMNNDHRELLGYALIFKHPRGEIPNSLGNTFEETEFEKYENQQAGVTYSKGVFDIQDIYYRGLSNNLLESTNLLDIYMNTNNRKKKYEKGLYRKNWISEKGQEILLIDAATK